MRCLLIGEMINRIVEKQTLTLFLSPVIFSQFEQIYIQITKAEGISIGVFLSANIDLYFLTDVEGKTRLLFASCIVHSFLD